MTMQYDYTAGVTILYMWPDVHVRIAANANYKHWLTLSIKAISKGLMTALLEIIDVILYKGINLQKQTLTEHFEKYKYLSYS